MEATFLILSKNNSLLLKHYIFGDTQDFLRIVHECFDVVSVGEEVVEIKFPAFRASIYFASENDVKKDKVEGHVLIDFLPDVTIPVSEIQSIFKDFVIKTNSYLFLISDQEERLVLKPNGAEELN